MPPKISEQVYIQRIKSAGNDRFEFLGWDDCFTNNRSKAVVKCLIDDHVWSATVSSLLTGRGCPVCKRRRYHPDERIEQLKLLGKDRYEFVSWVDKTFGSAVLKCIHDGHVWSNSLHTIIGKNIGCPVCSKSYRRTETESIDAINTAGYSKFKFVRWVDGYKTVKSKVVLRCEVDGHEWTSTINNIVNLGNGCPKCKHYGFKKLSPATFYLYKWTHPHTGDYFSNMV